LKLKCEEPLSDFAFDFNLCRFGSVMFDMFAAFLGGVVRNDIC
jgi:hypothetical protein